MLFARILNLRTGIPMMLIGLAAGIALTGILFVMPTAIQLAEQREEETLHAELSYFQGVIKGRINQKDMEGVEREVAAISSHAHIQTVLMLDGSNKIIAASRLAWRGRLIHELDIGFDDALAGRARQQLRILMKNDENTMRLYGYVPITRGTDVGSGSLLVFVHDMKMVNISVRNTVLRQAYIGAAIITALALLFLVLFRLFFSRRIDRLLEVSSRLEAGKLSARTGLHGEDEISRIGMAFDAMAGSIQKSQERIARSEEQLKFALEAIDEGLWDWDIERDRAHFSRRWKQILGLADEQVRNNFEFLLSLVDPEQLEQFHTSLRHHLEEESSHFEFEHIVRTGGGFRMWVHTRGKVVLRDHEGKPLRMVGTMANITERKQLESELREMAMKDSLTGLLNRRSFLELLRREISRADRYGKPLVLLMSDLDHFKQVNDAYGHAAGDEALRKFASTALGELRSNDLLGRFGGEEFIIALPDTSAESAAEVAERLRRKVEATTIDTGGESFSITVSIGIIVREPGSLSEAEMLRLADRALYAAKEQGRNCTHLSG